MGIDKKYMDREFYENDKDGFFFNGIWINCFEQMEYQALRNYQIDYYLYLLDDINIKIINEENKEKIVPFKQERYTDIIKFYKRTEHYSNSWDIIKQIIDNKNIVIFQTMFDALKTYRWYKKEGPYNRSNHYSLILGYERNFVYYVDSPTTRSLTTFKKSTFNSTVGIIKKEDLLNAFSLHCLVGEFIIEGLEKNKIDINKILLNMKDIYKNGGGNIGRNAYLVLISYTQERLYEIIESYECALIKSQYLILKKCIENYYYSMNKEKILLILEDIIKLWDIIKKSAMEKEIHRGQAQEYLCSWFENILKFSDQLFALIGD